MNTLVRSLFSKVYAFLNWLDRISYKTFPSRIKKVNARVISVGNITWGGTGKTPLVARIAAELARDGKKIAILTRGYGRDEVLELEKKVSSVPIYVGRDRIHTAREAVRRGAEILILDDGFQHQRLHREVNVVTINSTLPFGPGGLVPEGTLREPIEGLARGTIFVLTKSNIGFKNLHWIRQKLVTIKPDAVIFEAQHKPIRLTDPFKSRTMGCADLKNRNVAALSGIGDPFSFEKTVEHLGARIVLAARFDDHHRYSCAEISDFLRRCRHAGIREVISTEKDFFRLKPCIERVRSEFRDFNFWILEIEFEMNDEDEFIRRCLGAASAPSA